MVDKVPFTGIWTTFGAYIIPYHNEDISGFNLTYGVQIQKGYAFSHIIDPSLPITYLNIV